MSKFRARPMRASTIRPRSTCARRYNGPIMTNRTPLAGPNVWTGAEIKNSKRWIRDMPASAVAELDAALAHVKNKGLDWSQITRADFPIGGLDGMLADIADELENGVGIMKLRGFPVDRYDENDLRKIYFGLGAHLGTPVFQNRSGELMRAIRDEGAHVGRTYGQITMGGETKDQKGTTFLSSYARTLTNGGLRFHTDRTDVVGLLCVRQARKGGVSTLASTPAIHNTILAKRPDLLDALFTDYWRSRFGEEGTGKDGSSTSRATAYPLPIFGVRDGKFTSHYSLTFIEAAPLEPGDLQLINSHVTYHGRTPFEDDASSGHDRLLLRIWLTMPNNRPLPAGHEVLWR